LTRAKGHANRVARRGCPWQAEAGGGGAGLPAGLGRVRTAPGPPVTLTRYGAVPGWPGVPRLGRYGDARALLRDTVDRLGRILPDGDPLIIELRQSLADIGEE
jgi:hypothetical protein